MQLVDQIELEERLNALAAASDENVSSEPLLQRLDVFGKIA